MMCRKILFVCFYAVFSLSIEVYLDDDNAGKAGKIEGIYDGRLAG